MQKQLTEKLINICDITIPEQNSGFTLEDIKKIEIKLDIQINIVCAENLNAIIYSGSNKDVKIYLYKNKNHFDVINSMPAFFGSSYNCHDCKTPYNKKININVKRKKINVKFVMEKLIQVKLLKLQNGLIAINALDGFTMKNVLKIIKIMEHVKQFGNVRSVRKSCMGKH